MPTIGDEAEGESLIEKGEVMKTYKVIETIYYYVEADSEARAFEVFDNSNFDKADASKVYREVEEAN